MTLPGNRAPHLDSLLQPASVAVVGARDDGREAQINAVAARFGMTVLGPNTIVDAKATTLAREVPA
jgi:acyl-CoA synthetase (NDP forming)